MHKAAAFDGLLQYLQDYKHGLRELLVNDNVVIIEPVRQSTARPRERKSPSESTCRITGATVKNGGASASNTLPRQQPVLRRHFFYHPVRSNRELVDEELPDPDKVRHAREIFERSTKMNDTRREEFGNANFTIETNNATSPPAKAIDVPKSENKVRRRYLTVDTVFRHDVLHRRWTDSGSMSSGVSSDLSCCETDADCSDTYSRREEPTDAFSSDDTERNDVDDGHYVAPEVLERIRACGTTVTYYGGQVIAASDGPARSPITLAIMDEIQKSKNCPRDGQRRRTGEDGHLGVRFRLVKSNSCGSRLELAGTEDERSWKEGDENGKDEGEVCHERGNEDKSNKQIRRSSETECRQGAFGQTHTYDGRGAPKTCFSPEKPKLTERGGNVSFDDMEFEEFEIAEDSLNVIEERDIEGNSTDEDPVRHVSPRDTKAVGATGPDTRTQSNDSEEMSKNSNSKAHGDVQMTTWASRSMLFDVTKGQDGGCRPRGTSGPNHSSC
jgi:hypothetical protein